MAKEIHEEDIHAISNEAMALIDARLKEFGLQIPKTDTGYAIYDTIVERLEEIAGYPDYRNYN